MYDTSPDLQSYIFTLRRLWILPVLIVAIALILGNVTKPEPQQQISGTFQVPEPALLSTVSRLTILYDATTEAARLATEIEVSNEVESLEVEQRPNQSIVEVSFTAESEEGVSDRIDEVNTVIAEVWQEQMSATIAPALEITHSTVQQFQDRIEQWDTIEGEFAAVERVRAEQSLMDAVATTETLEKLPTTPPTLSGISVEPAGGAKMRSLILAFAGVFVGVGLIVFLALIDKRVRRRSFLERNGLTVLAVTDAQGSNLDLVPIGLIEASGKTTNDIAIVKLSGGLDTRELHARLSEHPNIGSVAESGNPTDAPSEFIDTVKGKDGVVLFVASGTSNYVQMLETARSAVTAGASNVCAVIQTRSSTSRAEAVS